MDNTGITRRDFVKTTATAVGTVAMASSGLFANPTFAFADTTLANGTYKVNANLYISKTIVLIHKDAYFTNPTDPNENGDMPETPNTDLNATMMVKDGTYTVTVPLVNECFMLLSATDGTKVDIDESKTKTKVSELYTRKNGDALTRITEMTFVLSEQASTYTLGNCVEYGAYEDAPWPMSMYIPGELKWTATLAVDFSTAVLA